MSLTLDNNYGVWLGDKLVAPPNYISPIVSSSKIIPNVNLIDHAGIFHSIQDVKWFMGYEGTTVRVWLHPETDELMLSTNGHPDAREAKYGRSKTFGEIGRIILPERDILFRKPGMIHHIVFVDRALQISNRFHVAKPFGLWLYTTMVSPDGRSFKVFPNSSKATRFPPKIKGLLPKETDFEEKYNRIVSRRELTLSEVNKILESGMDPRESREPIPNGEFVYFETPEQHHIRVESPAYMQRRQIVGNDPISKRRYEHLVDFAKNNTDEFSAKFPSLGIPCDNFGEQITKTGKCQVKKKKWIEMSERELELSVWYLFLICNPRYLSKSFLAFAE